MTDASSELIEQVNEARGTGRTLAICGGGSKTFMGRQTTTDEILDMTHHRGIVDYHPVELVLTARAGTPLAEIEAALAEHDQMLAFEPPHFGGGATLGGTLACNQSGPARPWSGSIRDAVLGIRLINGRGEHLRFGGQVMKNVAGYDVSRTQAGALGTLGAITEVSLKVMPKPACRRTLIQEATAEEALLRMNQLSGQPKPLTGACWHEGALYLRLAGAESAVTSTARQWGGDNLVDDHRFWNDLRDQKAPFFDGDMPLWRFSVRSSAPHWRPGETWLIDWGGAQRWLRGHFALDELETEARASGGQSSLYRGDDRDGEVFAAQPAPLQKFYRELKAAFDPHGIFNPGRLYSWM